VLLYRGGIGATLGAIGAQLPYPYVHLVYWTVQLLLAITAIQYGCDIGVEWYSKANGKGLHCSAVSHSRMELQYSSCSPLLTSPLFRSMAH
jgi:hypothetical protein